MEKKIINLHEDRNAWKSHAIQNPMSNLEVMVLKAVQIHRYLLIKQNSLFIFFSKRWVTRCLFSGKVETISKNVIYFIKKYVSSSLQRSYPSSVGNWYKKNYLEKVKKKENRFENFNSTLTFPETPHHSSELDALDKNSFTSILEELDWEKGKLYHYKNVE